MLNHLIRFSLKNRALIIATALLVIFMGARTATELPVEVLPDMTKPTVTVLTEAPGLAPEEVETLVTRPLENTLLGIGGLDRLRSNSDVGLSLVFVEFAWGTDIYKARQLVQERLQAAKLPDNTRSGMTPVSSLMGEILLVGLKSEDNSIAPMDLRTFAEWTVARRLQSIPGVAEVLAIGGGVKQVHVEPDPLKMQAEGVSLDELENAVTLSAGNATSGYLQSGPREIMVRNLAMTADPADIAASNVKRIGDRNITIGDVAEVKFGVATMRGDAGIAFEGDEKETPGIILSIDKAPGFDTLKLSADIEKALADLRPSLPAGVEAEILFRQGDFIDSAIGNLKEAIRDGAIMVTVILLLFLLNLRTTFITLTAIPLSFAITLLTFKWFGVSVNSMTLGGIAVAIGMVVDDAIVDVENVFRRLKENASLPLPRPRLDVIASASSEVRSSILYATILIILVFVPLLGLAGLEGRLFQPIAIATIVSMIASFVVSLTVIPVLCSFLLKPREDKEHRDGFLVRSLKSFTKTTFLRAAFGAPLVVIGVVIMLVVGAAMLYPSMGKEFLPTFNEGSATISFASAPGSSLKQSNEVGETAVKLLLEIDEVKSVGRRAGRAERDDHVMPVSVNEFDVEFHKGGRDREVVFAEIRDKLKTIPGTFVNVGQPIGHRLSHMLSGVSAKIAVKIHGPDLTTLRRLGTQVKEAGQTISGLTDVNLEAQVPIPQIRIEVNRVRARTEGLLPGEINQQVSRLLGGSLLGELREGETTVDLVLRLPESWRTYPEKISELLIQTPDGRHIPLYLVADIYEVTGPNVINRENGQRRIVIGANTDERDLESLVKNWQLAVADQVKLPPGYTLRFEGEYLARQQASKRILILFGIVAVVIAVLLTGYFRSVSLSLQVMLNLPLALAGALAFTWCKIDNISIATLVGFIAVGGVAARNGIMMISHYLHLMRHEGETFGIALITRGTLERLVPVLMTALSAGIALIPLVLSPGEPGKEILHPVAVAIVGGLISSTLLDLVVTPAVFYLIGRKATEKALRLDAPATR
ncbi:MAG: efflux RND transporter permease subunit [Akkermansiaceae bacterium]|jgi:CzcA family heavy metal efflux pump|nr:efflux RND transporter permease subunit [Luteolibacter sp.]